MDKLKIVFMGTPDFAVPCLQKLHEKYEVIAVITQPDRPKGRGQKLAASPVKTFALNAGLKVLQPEKIKTPEFEAILKGFHPDVIVVVAFGQILSKTILTIPPLGCINVHASLLPRYRGAAPIHWSIIRGEKISGVTTMFMDVGLDTGDMILNQSVDITEEMTTGELHDQLMVLGANLLLETIKQLESGTALRMKQDDVESSYAPLLNKAIGRIDWSLSVQGIHDLVRGLTPFPGAYCLFHNEKLKILRTSVYHPNCDEVHSPHVPGEIIKLTNRGFLIGTGEGILEIIEVQPANKRRMSARDYVRGHGIKSKDKFE